MPPGIQEMDREELISVTVPCMMKIKIYSLKTVILKKQSSAQRANALFLKWHRSKQVLILAIRRK